VILVCTGRKGRICCLGRFCCRQQAECELALKIASIEEHLNLQLNRYFHIKNKVTNLIWDLIVSMQYVKILDLFKTVHLKHNWISHKKYKFSGNDMNYMT
jgi:ABC-type dipeptide/oligopeptide/nickel transport system ATPase subunit